MAIFNEDYFVDESAYDEDEILDGMLEACDDMMDDMDELLDEHGGARNKYVKMKADEADRYKKMADEMPDKITSTRSKKIGPYTFSASKETNNKEKDNMKSKYYDSMKKASIYAGSGKETTSYHKEKDPDTGKTIHVGNGHMTYPDVSRDFAKNAGKPFNRYDSGSHSYIDKDKNGHYRYNKSKHVDYARMNDSKIGKDKFMKDFGGPNTNKYPHKIAGDQKWNKEELKNHFDKKRAVKEACLQILADLDEV